MTDLKTAATMSSKEIDKQQQETSLGLTFFLVKFFLAPVYTVLIERTPCVN